MLFEQESAKNDQPTNADAQSEKELFALLKPSLEREAENAPKQSTRRGFLQAIVAAGVGASALASALGQNGECGSGDTGCPPNTCLSENTCFGDNSCDENTCEGNNSCEASNACGDNRCGDTNHCSSGNTCFTPGNSCDTNNTCVLNTCEPNECKATHACNGNTCGGAGATNNCGALNICMNSNACQPSTANSAPLGTSPTGIGGFDIF